jgi:hypothetical protein
MASAIATSLWTSRNQALAQGDADTISAIETGPARLIDAYNLVMAQCGCAVVPASGTISSLQVIVPQQAGYPLDFLAAAQVGPATTPELMVLTKASPQASWLIAFDTSGGPNNQVGLLDAPTEPGMPLGLVPPSPNSAGVRAFQELVSYIAADPNDNGPASTPFGYTTGIPGVVEALYEPYGQKSGSSSDPPPSAYTNAVSGQPAAGFWTFAAAGMEKGVVSISCGTVQNTTTFTATTSAPLVEQGPSHLVIAPGDYSKVLQVTAVETCVMGLSNGSLDDYGNTQGQLSASGTPAP